MPNPAHKENAMKRITLTALVLAVGAITMSVGGFSAGNL
jgi:hypothetical protein